MSALSDAWSRYGPTAIGLALGTAAKYGVSISDGKRPTRLEFAADVLMLGFLGLLGVIASDLLNLTGNMKVFAAALAALMSARLVKEVRDRAQVRAAHELDSLVGAARAADAVRVPGGTKPATTITVIKSLVADPRAAGVERLADEPTPPSRADFDQLLAKIDRADKPAG